MHKRLSPTKADEIREYVGKNMDFMTSGCCSEEKAAIFGKSNSTYSRRRKDPMSLTLREIWQICLYFGVSPGAFVERQLELK